MSKIDNACGVCFDLVKCRSAGLCLRKREQNGARLTHDALVSAALDCVRDLNAHLAALSNMGVVADIVSLPVKGSKRLYIEFNDKAAE